MTTDHVAVALLAGTFRWTDESDPNPLKRTAQGAPFVECHIELTEQRGSGRVHTTHYATAQGPTALRIATTFNSGDLVVMSGDLEIVGAHPLPILSLHVKRALRMPEVPLCASPASLNVAYAVGTARDATSTRLGDGTPATFLTLACVTPPPSQKVNHHTVVLKGAVCRAARTIGAGDTIRADGKLGVHTIGGQQVWGLACDHLRVLERFPARTPLLPAAERSLQRAG
jgi:hypothetical protein